MGSIIGFFFQAEIFTNKIFLWWVKFKPIIKSKFYLINWNFSWNKKNAQYMGSIIRFFFRDKIFKNKIFFLCVKFELARNFDLKTVPCRQIFLHNKKSVFLKILSRKKNLIILPIYCAFFLFYKIFQFIK